MLSTKQPKCRYCRKPLDDVRRRLHNECQEPWITRQLAKQAAAKAKKERAAVKARKEKLKTRREWIAEAQTVINRYVRLRDAGCGCISCGNKPGNRFGGTMDCGHFRSVGSAPHLRFHLWNMAAQCVRCNQHLGGNAIEYRRGLVERRGLERVEQIEAMQGVAKWDIPYLKRLKAVFAKKTRRLEKRA
mgnify:CR=1 FL=1